MTSSPPAEEFREMPCTACGMCCDGTLYSRARVAEGEEDIITGKGLMLENFEGKTYFQLPCKYVNCGRCTIYEDRFIVCRKFDCALLRRFKAGEVGPEEAHRLIATAKELRAAVVATDPEAHDFQERLITWETLSAQRTVSKGAEKTAIAQRLLQILALDTFLERRFRNKKRQFK